jgi:hypothetical protein
MRLLGQSPSPTPCSCPYSPKCVEGKLSEVRLTSISPKYLEGAVFGLQPTLLLFVIFSIKVIEKVKDVRDLLRQEYRNGEEERCESCFMRVCATASGA